MFGYFSEITEPERRIYQNTQLKKEITVTGCWDKKKTHI